MKEETMLKSDVYKGRPENAEGRLPKEIKVYDFLDSIGIEYYCVDHEPAMTVAMCDEIDKALNISICKNMFLCNRQQTEYCVLLMPGHKKYKAGELSKQIGSSRMGFAPEDKMLEFFDITPGSMSITGFLKKESECVALYLDEDIIKEEYFGFHPSINTTSIRIKTKDLIEKIIPSLAKPYKTVILPLE